MAFTRSHYVRMNYGPQIELLRKIEAGNLAITAADEYDLEERGLIVGAGHENVQLTPAGRKLLAEAAPQA